MRPILSASVAMVALDAAVAYAQHDGFLAFPLKASLGNPFVTDITKRQTSDTGLESRLTGTIYTIDVTLGTPGQTVSLQFDTGSSEMWMNPICSKSADPLLCVETGRFTASTSFVDLGVQGGIQYGIGYVEFEYGYDSVMIGGK